MIIIYTCTIINDIKRSKILSSLTRPLPSLIDYFLKLRKDLHYIDVAALIVGMKDRNNTQLVSRLAMSHRKNIYYQISSGINNHTHNKHNDVREKTSLGKE